MTDFLGCANYLCPQIAERANKENISFCTCSLIKRTLGCRRQTEQELYVCIIIDLN